MGTWLHSSAVDSDENRDDGPEVGPACLVTDIQVRQREWRPEGARGWGQRSPVEVGEATSLSVGGLCVLGERSAMELHLRLYPCGCVCLRSEGNFQESVLAFHFVRGVSFAEDGITDVHRRPWLFPWGPQTRTLQSLGLCGRSLCLPSQLASPRSSFLKFTFLVFIFRFFFI